MRRLIPRAWAGFAVLVVAVAIVGGTPPPRPSSFYGTVTAGGSNVASGTLVSAWIGGTKYAETAVSLADGLSVYRLDVLGDLAGTPAVEGGLPGQTITLKVGGAQVQTATWQDGSYVRLDLTAALGPDLAVTVDDGVTTAAPGGTLTYTVTVINHGPGTATGVAVRDTLSAGTSFVSASDGGTAAGSVVTWPAFDLAQGQTATRTVTARVLTSFPAGLETITNMATVADDGTQGVDPRPDDNTDADVDALNAPPDLVVTVSNGVNQALPGQRLEYAITVSNAGTREAAGVVLRNTLPDGVTLFAASDSGVESGRLITWPSFTLAPGASVSRRFTGRVDDPLSPAVSSLVDIAEATEASGTDPNPGDNTATDLDPVVQKPDLVVASVDTAGSATDPQTLAVSGTVTVEVGNEGNLDVSGGFALVLFEDRDGNGTFTAATDNLLGQKNVTVPVLADGSASVSVPVAGTVLFRDNRISAFADSGLAIAEHDETNNVGHTGDDCGRVPSPGDFEPVLELNWPRPGIVEPFVVDSASSPVVVDLDGNGVPDIIFTTSNLDQALGSFDQSVLRAIRGDTGDAIFNVQSFHDGFRFWEFELATVAAGDIDLDGKPEIITTNLGISVIGEPVNAITAYEHDGRRKWRSPIYSTHPQGRWNNRDNPTIADIDRNGVPEIIVGAHVFNNNGTLRWKGTGGQAFQSIFNTNGPASGAISLVADLDLSGNPEIVTGNTAYRSDGSIWWQIAHDDGYPAVANFDDDPFPEIVVVSKGKVRLHEHDGALKWGPVVLPGRTPVAGGPPTVADFDADGEPEIGVASSDFYVVFETDGTVKWQRSTQDFSSGMTGSTVFDFDGDGRFEVVYRDEVYLRVYRGEDGTVLFEYPVPSTTLNEQPTVADVDNDGNAEILVTADHGDSDSGVPGNANNAGLRVFGDANDNWVGTRAIWNQHAYSVGNVNDDATIPREPDWSWLSHNTYRAQIAPPGTTAFAAPDLTASRAVVDLSAYPAVTVTVRVGNGGGATVKAGLPVAFYDDDPAAGGQLLGTKAVSKALKPGEYEDVSFTFTETDFADRTLVVAADDDGAGKSRDSECDEANNRYAYTYDLAVLGLTLAMSDGQTAVGAGETFTYNLTIFNAAGHPATGVALTDQIPPHTSVVSASDGGSESGGVVTWPAFNLASGAIANRSLTLLVSEAIPLAVTSLTNQASVTDDGSHGPDPTPANNSASDTNRVSSVRARAGGPYDGDEGVAIAFDASGSTDRDGTIVSYQWDLDADGAFDDATGATASRTFPDEGSFTVALQVTDNSGETDIDTATVTVRNAAPVVEAGPDLLRAETDSVTLAATFTDTGVTDTHTATIDWGDGSPVQAGVVTETNGAGSVAGGHAYPDNGSFTVTVCVADNDGATVCDSFALTVENANPVVTPTSTVDLRTWRPEAYAAGSATWNVAADGQSVVQTVNGNPAFFYGDFGSFGVRLEGKIRTTDTDDDFMGFALGFRPGDAANPNADFLVVDWKQNNQGGSLCGSSTTGRRGLAVSRVRGIPSADELWAHANGACNGSGNGLQELARGRTRGNTGWVRNQTYTFTFESTATSLKVWVDGTLEIDITGTFSPGRFAFYNYSQAQVTYSALSSQNLGGEEGSAITARGTFTDVGLQDTHTASLSWGDGAATPGTVTQGTGSGSVIGSHAYQDEGGYTLDLCVTDDDGGTGCAPIPVTVLNVTPAVNAGPDRLTYAGEDASIEPVTFTDPGVLDTHTATINWGDGQTTAGTVTESGGSGAIAGTHTYAANGAYTVTVCATDNDGATGCDSFSWQRLDPVLDLRLTKAADRKFARPNQNVLYTLTLANIGTREPQGVVLTDTLPPHLTFISASDGGVWNAATRTITWTIARVAYQQTLTRTVTARVDAAAPFNTPAVNTAQVTDDGRFGPDVTPADNTASVTVTLWDGLTPFVDGGADRSVVEGDVVTLSAPFNDTTTGEAHTFTIDWGDGTTTNGAVSGSQTNNTIPGSHAYPEQGSFTLRVCVRDAAGRTGCDEVAVTVANGAPRVNDDAGVDLRRWRAESYGTGPNWAVSADGRTVTQTINSVPTIFYGDFPAFGNRIEGTIRVLTSGDDDFIGFVLGFLPGDTTSANANYLLVDWKKQDQAMTLCGTNMTALRGLAVSRIQGIPNEGEFWLHRDGTCNGLGNGIEELARGITRSRTAWVHNTDYKFTFEFSATRLLVYVNDTLELDVQGDFRNGRLGFYNASQEQVRYSSFTFAARITDEGQPVEMAPTFGDPGVQDTHTATLEWGDGETTPADVEQGTGFGTVRGTHTYGDNGAYTVRTCVTDDEGAAGCGSFPVTVRNVAPVVDAAPDLTVSFGAPVTADLAAFTDPGFRDTHTATINWGDGTTTAGTVTETNGAGTVSGTRTYASAGTRTVQVCVKDDDNAQTCDTLTVTVVNPPVLSARKTAALQTDSDGSGVVSPGDVLSYEIAIANSGGPATGVSLADAIPAHTALVPGSVTTSKGTVAGENPVTVDVGVLAGGETATVRFAVTLDAVFPDEVDEVVNQGAVRSNELPELSTDDPGAPGAADPTRTPVAKAPELTATKVDELAADPDGDGVPSPGDELLYTIIITNSGGSAANDVVLTDLPSAHTRVVAGSVSTTAGTVASEDPVRVEVGRLAVGAPVTVAFRVTIDDPVPAGVREVSNQGAVTSRELPAVLTDDPDLGGASDPTVTAITAAPKLVAEKTDALADDADGDGAPSPGDTIEYRVTILNNGNTSATGVAFEDAVPEHAALVPGSVQASQGTVESEDPVRVTAGEIRGGERAKVTFRVVLDDPIATGVREIRNQGTVTSHELPAVPTDDPEAGGTDDPTVTAVSAAPVLRVEKTDVLFADADGDGAASPGDTLLYRLTVTNSGNTGATEVVLTDPIPANASLVAGTVQTSQGTVESEEPVRVALGEVAAGATATVSFQVRVDEAFPHTAVEVANQAMVESGELEAVASDDPETPEAADPTRTPIFITPDVAIGDAAVDENGGQASLTVTLSKAGNREVRVSYATGTGTALAGADYTPASGVLTFAPGETSKTLAVPVLDDLLDELDETFPVALSAPAAARLADAEGAVTIRDNDAPPQVSIGDASVTEGDDGTVIAAFAVTLSAPSGLDVTVPYATTDGTAQAGSDYQATSGALLFPAGTTARTVSVEVTGDRIDELDETFAVSLSSPVSAVLARAAGQGTIVDDDEARLSTGDARVPEGNSGTAALEMPVTLSTASDREVRVEYSTSPDTATAGTDYTTASGTLTFPPGTTRRIVGVPVLGDVFLEPDETFFLDLAQPVNASLEDGRGTGTIVDDEVCPGPNLLANSGFEARLVSGAVPGWTTTEGAWQRRASNPVPAEGSSYLASAAGSPAELRQDVDVSAYAARIAGGGQIFRFSGFVRTASEDPSDVARIVVEYRDASNTVVLDAFDSGEIASPAEWQAVFDERPAPAGTAWIRVLLAGTDAWFDGLSLVSLRAATLTVGDVAVYEGHSGTTQAPFPVRLACLVEGEVQASYATADGTALAGQDYLAASGSLTFPQGTISATVPVSVLGDDVHERHETFTLDLTQAAGSLVLLDPRGTGTILNDDFCPRSPGFWKTHNEIWPVQSLVIGGVEYNASGLSALLSYNGSDAASHLARQLVATELNLRVGSDPSILPIVRQAHDLLVLYPSGSNPRGAARDQVNQVKDRLDAYNNLPCQEDPVIPVP
ncbi:MAG TPA: Calx-beta domain-containing protein [Thermoanaerobaculia bacterium]